MIMVRRHWLFVVARVRFVVLVRGFGTVIAVLAMCQRLRDHVALLGTPIDAGPVSVLLCSGAWEVCGQVVAATRIIIISGIVVGEGRCTIAACAKWISL